MWLWYVLHGRWTDRTRETRIGLTIIFNIEVQWHLSSTYNRRHRIGYITVSFTEFIRPRSVLFIVCMLCITLTRMKGKEKEGIAMRKYELSPPCFLQTITWGVNGWAYSSLTYADWWVICGQWDWSPHTQKVLNHVCWWHVSCCTSVVTPGKEWNGVDLRSNSE